MKGLALILTLLIVAVALVIVSGSASIFVAEIAASKQIDLSTVAFYVADAGIEGALYAERINNPSTGTAGLTAGTDNCQADASGTPSPGTNVNADTCLANLSNNGDYYYVIENDVGDPREVTSTGEFRGMKRSIRVEY